MFSLRFTLSLSGAYLGSSTKLSSSFLNSVVICFKSSSLIGGLTFLKLINSFVYLQNPLSFTRGVIMAMAKIILVKSKNSSPSF